MHATWLETDRQYSNYLNKIIKKFFSYFIIYLFVCLYSFHLHWFAINDKDDDDRERAPDI